MKLNRKILKKLILEEIKRLSESNDRGDTAGMFLLNVNDYGNDYLFVFKNDLRGYLNDDLKEMRIPFAKPVIKAVKKLKKNDKD